MVKLLREDREEFSVPLADLHDLKETNIPDVNLARRELDREHIDTLVLSSDPTEWPPILISKTDIGYVVIDGYHRLEAARLKGMTEIRATSKTYKNEQELIEAVFQANLKHGLKSSPENRSNYAYWLHITYPKMEQQEIAARAGIKQATVSKAIARREAKEEAKAEGKSQEREAIVRTVRDLTRDATKLMKSMSDLPESEQRAALIESLGSIQDREALLKIARLLEDILEPKKRARR
jgi:ParB-like chromosome segregation protein Spo0J